MTVLLALAVAVLFASGAYLLLRHDILLVTVGVILISNAVNLFLMSARLLRGQAPILPLPAGAPISDPLVQALTLTSIVITFGMAGVLLSLVYRAYTQYQTLDLSDVDESPADETEAA